MTGDMEQEFKDAMLSICEQTKEFDYNPTYFRRMVYEYGGTKTAQKLLTPRKHQEGLTTLWKKKHLELSMEALVLKKCWRGLFTQEELDEAYRRLEERDYFKEERYRKYWNL